MSRRDLGRLVSVMLFAVVLFFAWVGIRTLSPTAAVEASRPSVRIPNIAIGAFEYIADPLGTQSWPSELLVVRDLAGKSLCFASR